MLASGMMLPNASPITRAVKASRKGNLCGASKQFTHASERTTSLIVATV
jgi:hypothetical protein